MSGIFLNGRYIKDIYLNGRKIKLAYCNHRRIFNLASSPIVTISCFSNGYWMDEYPWLDNVKWND